MKKVFYLKTCGTCKKIMSQYDLSDWDLREIKSKPVTEEELDEMYAITQSYESLFSKKSTQIKARGIDTSSLKEADYKHLILDHYSFLKRPVFLTDHLIFAGSDKKNLENLHLFFENQDQK
ncbi:ArsC family protein [Epilithonimonas bovis DSM 19482]|jgi:arsenate reductase-like glutaredoxin family protein|uniref:ArsC family protein n=1 Tax=Epilithonimonas bovis DSM 19482 TaxID=1121284 RepID=A0A1U7Q1K5_9FLAO|nr:ArsC/Spx/MgsR family protein [Epilithonimonas bovis]MDN5627500.1 arsenate reductase family protein [Weeksellaceae bacterium]QIY82463.1 arsenate reductase family protein [Chryseobacterium sp. NEB161]SIT98967.1 ArsC family protein [Epilithonimonas bovis DSM 19482]